MSSHLAKTNSPAGTAGGNQNRRTPLSLTGAGKATGNSKNAASSTVAMNQATDKNDQATSNAAAASISDASISVVSKDVEMKKLSSKNIAAATDTPAVNKDSEMKKSQSKQNEISSASQENGYTNGHKRNDHKDDDKKMMNTSETTATTNTEKKDPIPLRESQRKKDKQQHKVEKESSRKTDSSTMSPNEKGGSKKNEKNKDKISDEGESKKKSSAAVEKVSDKKDISTEGDTLKKEVSKEQSDHTVRTMNTTEIQDEKKKKEPKEISKESENKKQQSAISVATEAEKLKNAKDQNEKIEMEPLIFENEGELPGHPGASSTPGKVLKHREGPLSGEYHQSKTNTLIQTDSAVSTANSEKTAATTTSDYSYSYTYSKQGKISGRRSIRPLPDISFENRYRGYYRPIPDDDRWTSSMNVTVGSEIRNESTNSSFSFFSRGKKRERTPPPSTQLLQSTNQIMDDAESPKSPKRARLDISGFFGNMASPITKLLTKFSRTKLHSSSTPNCGLKRKQNNLDVSINDEDKKAAGNGEDEDVLNVSSVIAEDVTAVLDENDENNMVEGDDGVSITVEGEEIVTTNKDNANIKITENDDDVDDDIIIKEKPLTLNESVNKRKTCNVM